MGLFKSACFISFCPDPEDHLLSNDILQTQDDPGGFMLASVEMTSQPAGTVGKQVVAASTLMGQFHAAKNPLVPLCLRYFESSCLDVIQQVLWEKSISRRYAMMCFCIWKSSSKIYQGKPLSLSDWCSGRCITSVLANMQQLTDFFIHLHQDKFIFIPAVKGYYSTLNHIFVEGL